MSSDPIVIVGMACRVPGATTLDAFRQAQRGNGDQFTDLKRAELLAEGVTEAQLADLAYVPRAPVLKDIAGFDRAYFGLAQSQAEVMDPQHRIFMETAVEALENGCIATDRDDLHIGVFASASISSYLLFNLLQGLQTGASAQTLMAMTSNDKDYLASHTAYLLGLRGPAVGIQTACSSSLVGVHMAVRSVLDGECDVALSGGVSIRTPHRVGYLHEPGSILSPTGTCRSFDENADGTVFGSGAGVVALTRLSKAKEEGWPIYASVLGSAVNNDGANKAGYTAPGLEGQSAVIAEALAVAGLGPDDIGYIEGHGTGTPIGDPIEVRALAEVFGARRADLPKIALGSAKARFGHLETASGIVGLISASLAISDQTLPALAHFGAPNPHFDLVKKPFSLHAMSQQWPNGTPRRAGVSSFGIGGTNAHVILGEIPKEDEIARVSGTPIARIYPVSAQTPAALASALSAHTARLEELTDFDAAVRTATTGRTVFDARAAVVAASAQEAADALRDVMPAPAPAAAPTVGFVFSGQGGRSWPDVAALRNRFNVFRDIMDQATGCLPDLKDIFEGQKAPDPADTAILQPALFALQAALTRCLAQFCVTPAVVCGHSVGEIAAAWAAGMVSFDEALGFARVRGQLMAQQTGGAMASVATSPAVLRSLLAPGATLAVYNGPKSLVVSGSNTAVEATIKACAARGIVTSKLAGSVAFHAPQIAGCAHDLAQAAAPINSFDADCGFISTLTGGPMPFLPQDHWQRHALEPVAFEQAIAAMVAQGVTLLVEIGPGSGLSAVLRQNQTAPECLPALGGKGDARAFLNLIGALFTRHCDVDLHVDLDHGPMARLPNYPFQRTRHWISPKTAANKGLKATVNHKTSLWPERPDWLADHIVNDRCVMPAAGFAAYMMGTTGGSVVADIQFDAMLEIPAQGIELSIEAQQNGAIAVLAAEPGLAAQPYASMHPGAADATPSKHVLLTDNTDLNAVDTADFYATLTDRGIALGRCMQRLSNIIAGQNTARAQISTEATQGHGFGAALHPVVLDGMFQVLAAAASSVSEVPHVPVSIDALEVFGEIPHTGECQCHASIRKGADGLVGDITLYAPGGSALAHVSGLTSRAVTAVKRSILYEAVWVKDPQPHLPSPRDVMATLPIENLEGTAQQKTVSSYLERVDKLASIYLAQALHRLAGDQQLSQITLPDPQAHLYQRLLARYIDMLTADGMLDPQRRLLAAPMPTNEAEMLSAHLLADFPDHGLETALLQHCGSALADILTGQIDPTTHLFSDGIGQLGALYGEGTLSRKLNALVSDVMTRAADAQTGLRVLELGGGTGGSTRHVLPSLAGAIEEYRFTDLSSGFFPAIKEQFGNITGFCTTALNVEHPFEDQGTNPDGYHMVLASNALHAAGDLRAAVRHSGAALCSGGWLILIEGFVASRWLDLTFGLTVGWWPTEDRELRPDYPLMSQDQWRVLLSEEGFDAVEIVTLGIGRLAEQGIVLARKAPSQSAEIIDACGMRNPSADVLARLQNPTGTACRMVATQQATQLRPFEMPDPAQAAVSGLVKAALLEDRTSRLRVVDIDQRQDRKELLSREGRINDPERATAWRDGHRYLERLAPVRAPSVLPNRFAASLTEGDLKFLERDPAPLAPNEVEIELRAAGLNFKDVLTVLGIVPPAGGLGSDISGIVVRVGSNVIDLEIGTRVVALSSGAFASHVTVSRARVVPIADTVSFAQAASLPVAGMTAVHVFSELLALNPGDRVLIHTATGGVGHFATALAIAAGAEVFATAGSKAKRRYLRAQDIAHVFDSRNTDFSVEIRKIAPEGIDVVVNMLTGAAIEAGLDTLRAGGHFIELGRQNIRTTHEVAVSHPKVNYKIVSLDRVDDQTGGQLLASALHHIQDKAIPYPPLTVMPMAKIHDAVDLMKRGGHLGKIVLRQEPAFSFRSDHAYLITGAMGGIGLALAEAACTAPNQAGALHLTAHSPLTSGQQIMIADIEARGTKVYLHQIDLAQASEVDKLLDTVEGSALPLAGVFHAAGRLDDGLIGNLTPDRMAYVAAPKLTAAQRFDERLGDLDAFVLFSSAAGGLGSPGQGNHAAAATALDAVAQARHARGLRALSIDWGAWNTIGAASARGADVRAADQGVGTISPQVGLDALFEAIGSGLPRVFALPLTLVQLASEDPVTRNLIFNDLLPGAADLPHKTTARIAKTEQAGPTDLHDLTALPVKQRHHRLAEMIETRARRLMNIGAQDLSFDRPLQELGLDSLMSIELRNQLGLMTGQTLPTTLLFNHPTIESLATHLSQLIAPDAPENPQGTGAETDEIIYLDEDDLDRMLTEMENRYGTDET